MITVKEFSYSVANISNMENWKYASNWPIVYIMHNETDAYVGETLDGIRRTKQHLDEQIDTDYKLICMMTDKNFNKSVALDMESFLIKYMAADGKYLLHNGNAGIVDHNYFNRDIYRDEFRYTWSMLIEKGLANNTLEQIENSELFKYSPYKTLTDDQDDALIKILRTISLRKNSRVKNNLILVNGEAGTGKTILAIYIVKILKEMSDGYLGDYQDEDGIEKMQFLNNLSKNIGRMKIGFVVPMQSLRESLKNVFDSVEGLSSDMILKPSEVVGGNYDLLVVDEAHRLRRRKNLSQYPDFDAVNKKLGLDNTGTELDWIIQSSRMQLLFYDSEQSVRPSDIESAQFHDLINEYRCESIALSSQLRCKGGNDYVNYVKSIIAEKNTTRRRDFGDYDVRLFDDPNEMILAIKRKNDEIGLCRTVAGYGWKWLSKTDSSAYDISLNGVDYKWNTTATDWVNSTNAVNEIGCIHTIQGYDLNITGVIFGPEIRYDKNSNSIVINKSKYFDNLGKTKDETALKQYIKNIYVTLMTRGIQGTYIYAYDEALREYFKRFF